MVYILVFLSGFAGLVYQVLWMKQLGLLLGSTSQAAAVTLAAFFAGLAVGSWFWGRRSRGLENPLRLYVWLEAGIGVTALLYFWILDLYYQIYPALYQRVDSASLLLLVKFGLAALLIFPPAFFMGGTIPVMGQHAIRKLSAFGSTSARLYGINTLGAALGAGLAGFCLPLWLGFRGTCGVALAVTASVAFMAFLLSRHTAGEFQVSEPTGTVTQPEVSHGRWLLLVVAFLSGFVVLALEVLWTRMFAQVLENSVYTFSAILVVLLLALAMGSLLSAWLARLSIPPRMILALLLFLGGAAVVVQPFVFIWLTDSLHILTSKGTWLDYLGLIFWKVLGAIAIPAVLLGMLFPFLMKAEERHAVSAGESLGHLAAVNTAGAILGSLVCGFLLLGTLGMWGTFQVLAALYLVAALFFPAGWGKGALLLKSGSALLFLLLFTLLDPRGLPINSIDPMRGREVILETWEGSDCTVAVSRDRYGQSIKINSHYGLGSTAAYMQQKMQADVPLLAYPAIERIFFLGLGTGATAGSALDPKFKQVKRVVACELVPEVITAARKYMTNVEGMDFTGGLFKDPRATVLAEDGRHYLMATQEKFNLVNSDLFVPFRLGAGSLYSKEHFESVKARLEPGGVFFQWLPLYQVTEVELFTIARTMLDVFGQVSLWRNNFQPGDEVIAFAGHKDRSPLPANNLDTRSDRRASVEGKTIRDMDGLALPLDSQTILLFYCGNMTGCEDLFARYPINTDDQPVIEYMAPRSYRNRKDALTPWFVGPRLAKLVDELRFPVAGAAYHWARIWGVIGDEKECQSAWQRFVSNWTE
jgi:spermidine synthase